MLKRLLVASMLTVSLMSVSLVGCGPWIGDPMVEVIGEVTLDGKVLPNAKVVFVPKRFRNDDGLINPLAFGKTDGTGRFELRSGQQKGVLLGRYRVLVFKSQSQKDSRPQEETTLEGSAPSDGHRQIHRADPPIDLAKLLNEPSMPGVPVGVVPAKHNLYSELEYVVDLPVGIVYPKFDLLTSE